MKFKLVEISHYDNIRYVVQYKRWWEGWRYVQTYSNLSPSDYGIHCLDADAGESTLREALEAIVDYFKANAVAEGKPKLAFRTISKWKTIEDVEASLNALAATPPLDE